MPEMLVNIGWAGGWDEYVIDPSVTRLETPEEIAADAARVAKGWGGDPVIGHREWLRVLFVRRKFPDHPEHTLFKIVRYVRGGD